MSSARDGQGRRLFLQAGFLGAVRQIPPLAQALLERMPELHIDLLCDDKHGNTGTMDLIDAEIERTPSLSGRVHTYRKRGVYPPSADHKYKLLLLEDGLTIDSQDARFPIDPLKFEDRVLLSASEIANLRTTYGILAGDHVIVAGSIREHEIVPLIDAADHAFQTPGSTKMLLVPRTFDLCAMATHVLEEKGLEYVPLPFERKGLQYDVDSWESPRASDAHSRVIVVKRAGVLQDLYSLCDVAFLGNTYGCDRNSSGQNPLEPAFYGSMIVAGPARGNLNRVAYEGLERSGLLRRVETQDQLNEELTRIPAQDDLSAYRTAAQEFIASQKGAARVYALAIQNAMYGDVDAARNLMAQFE